MQTHTVDDNGNYRADYCIKAGRPKFEKAFVCVLCGDLYPESQLVKVKGKYYCTKFKHYEDA